MITPKPLCFVTKLRSLVMGLVLVVLQPPTHCRGKRHASSEGLEIDVSEQEARVGRSGSINGST